MLAMSVKFIFIFFQFFEIAHTNSWKILMTFLHAKIYDLSETSETSEILIRSCKLLVRIVQRGTLSYFSVFRIKFLNHLLYTKIINN
jgi:hypothetical protein